MSAPVDQTHLSPSVVAEPSPDSDPWWAGIRDDAYLNLLAGATLQQVSEGLGIPPRTLYHWRHHPRWRARLARDREQLLSRHQDVLFGLDDRAVQALHTHLPLDPRTNLEYLHRRGILPKRSNQDSMQPPVLLLERKGDRQ